MRAGGSGSEVGRIGRLGSASELPSSEHPEQVLAWLAEARRLFAEAEHRLESGQVLPALSSLAAVPPLHRMLVERCSELLDAHCGGDEADQAPTGLYL